MISRLGCNNIGRNKRSQRGVELIELAVGLIIVVPIFIALFELASIINVAQVNDNAAKEGSRIAAAGDPQTAIQRVQNVVTHVNQQSHFMASEFSLVSVTFTPTDILTQETKLVPYGGVLKGDISVRIKCTVKPWILALVSPNNPFVFNSEKTYPFTYTVPNTAGGMQAAP